MMNRPVLKSLIGKDIREVPMSCQRVMRASSVGEWIWVGPEQSSKLSAEDQKAYDLAHTIMCHLAVRAPTAHQSGHPGGPLSAFTFSYCRYKRRNPDVDQPYRMSAGHLSLLAYGLQWLFGREGNDARLKTPQSIIENFRIPKGLPGHVEAGIGDIPFGTGPLGKGVSNALGAAFGLKYLKKKGIVDVLLADGDCQEGQVMEALRLASHLGVDNLVVHGDFNDIQLSGLPSKTVAADFAAIVHATGWHVVEVQNGNDPAQVVAAQDAADKLLGTGRPVFICYYTTMGQGVALMEKGSNDGTENYHGTPLSEKAAAEALKLLPDFEKAIKEYEPFRAKEKKRSASGEPVASDFSLPWDVSKLKGYKRAVTVEKGAARKDFGATHLKNLMKSDLRIFVLHADLGASGGFDAVEKEFPERVLNVGVAEANMYMMAAGMRQVGLLPVTYTFAAFGTNEARASARLIDINCGHTRCAVLHDCTHAGVSVGEDGETHQDQNYLNIPFRHTQVWMPGDSNQAAAMAERGMEMVADGHTSMYVFSPRAGHEQLKTPGGDLIYGDDYFFDGKADLIRGRGDVTDKATIIATGVTIHAAVAAADALLAMTPQIQVRVLNIACIRPLDAAAIIQAALETSHLIVAEDHNVEGGLATQIADVLTDFSIPCSVRRLGLNYYFPSGTYKDLLILAGLDTDSIVDAVQDEIHTEVCGGDDIFVTALYELEHNLQHSRFRETALPFVEKLIQEKDYLETLRAAWVARACPRDRLPQNKDIREKLEEI